MFLPLGPSKSLIFYTSFAHLINEAAIISIPFFNPNSNISDQSCYDIVGKSTSTPGRFMFFLSPIDASFKTLTVTDYKFLLIYVTYTDKEPSAINILVPTFTFLGRFWQLQVISFQFPYNLLFVLIYNNWSFLRLTFL